MEKTTKKNRSVSILIGTAASASVLMLFIAVAAFSARPSAEDDTATLPSSSLVERGLSSLAAVVERDGRVAGAQTVPTASEIEQQLRNNYSAWLVEARFGAQAPVAYRDPLIDVSAQVAASRIAQACRVTDVADWQSGFSDRLLREGRVIGLDQSVFKLSGETISVLDGGPDEILRLYGGYDAFGVGVAETNGQQCDFERVVIFHLAEIR